MNQKEMFSFNSEFSEFELQQLEERLETDPLAVGGLVDFTTSNGPDPRCFILVCPTLENCPQLN